jgi:hypothetical protein
MLMRLATGLVFVVTLAAGAIAQTLTVTSPSDGDYLGRTNQVRFLISGATAQARVVVTVINQATLAQLIQVEGRFDPNVDAQISGALDLNFNEATPTAVYRVRVEHFQAGVLVSTRNVDNVNIDVRQPRFLDVTPANGAFVRDTVNIRARIEETNMDRWTVTVNNQSIPNNTGTTTTVSVPWSTADIESDGQQSILIRVEDLARNGNSVTRTVTLDRVAPTIQILSPGPTPFRPNTTIPVSVDIRDGAQGSVSVTGVNVVLRTMDGRFIARVPRRGAGASGGTLQWSGRIRATRNLPRQFKVVVTAVDRAGNPARPQEVIVNIAGRGP